MGPTAGTRVENCMHCFSACFKDWPAHARLPICGRDSIHVSFASCTVSDFIVVCAQCVHDSQFSLDPTSTSPAPVWLARYKTEKFVCAFALPIRCQPGSSSVTHVRALSQFPRLSSVVSAALFEHGGLWTHLAAREL